MQYTGGGGLPADYQQVEFLQATGSQYIIFPFSFQQYIQGTGNKEMRCIYEYASSALTWIVGSWYDETGNGGANIDNYNNGRWWLGGAYAISRGTSPNTKIEVVVSSSYSAHCTDQLVLFALYYRGGVRNASGTKKIYYFALVLDNENVIELIPCYRKADNAAGMYDTVNNVFHTNAGSGSFVVGPDVN